jgi:hypothetical protein
MVSLSYVKISNMVNGNHAFILRVTTYNLDPHIYIYSIGGSRLMYLVDQDSYICITDVYNF